MCWLRCVDICLNFSIGVLTLFNKTIEHIAMNNIQLCQSVTEAILRTHCQNF